MEKDGLVVLDVVMCLDRFRWFRLDLLLLVDLILFVQFNVNLGNLTIRLI